MDRAINQVPVSLVTQDYLWLPMITRDYYEYLSGPNVEVYFLSTEYIEYPRLPMITHDYQGLLWIPNDCGVESDETAKQEQLGNEMCNNVWNN